jgi:hypothetical protein
MHGERGDAAVFGDAGDGQRVFVLAIPAGADLQGYGYVDCLDHGPDDARHQRLILQQRRTGPHVAYFLRRATHVDVDQLRTVGDIETRRLGQHAGS